VTTASRFTQTFSGYADGTVGWTVHDVTAGRTVAGAIAPSIEDAREAAQHAQDDAERDAAEG
jgi:hypothetical protein